jgi:hypothetical protein
MYKIMEPMKTSFIYITVDTKKSSRILSQKLGTIESRERQFKIFVDYNV